MIRHPLPPKIPRVDEGRCQACEGCQARMACPTKAIMALDPGEVPFIDGSRCHGCMVCVSACPFDAVVV